MDTRLPAAQPSLPQSRRLCVKYMSPDSLRQDQKLVALSRILISPLSGPHWLLSNPCPSSEMGNGAAQFLLLESGSFSVKRAFSLSSVVSSLSLFLIIFRRAVSLFTLGFWELEHSKYQGVDPV